MKRIIAGIFFIACVFVIVGWSLAYGSGADRDEGYENASEKYQKNIEDIKRTQGDEGGRRDLHSYLVLQN